MCRRSRLQPHTFQKAKDEDVEGDQCDEHDPVVDAEGVSQRDFAEVAPCIHVGLQVRVRVGKQGCARKHAEDARQGVHTAFTQRTCRGAGAVSDQAPAEAEEQTAHDIRAENGGLEGQLHHAEFLQQVDADHGHDDVGEHELDDGHVLEAKGPELLVVAKHARLLEQKAEDDSGQDSVYQCHL